MIGSDIKRTQPDENDNEVTSVMDDLWTQPGQKYLEIGTRENIRISFSGEVPNVFPDVSFQVELSGSSFKLGPAQPDNEKEYGNVAAAGISIADDHQLDSSRLRSGLLDAMRNLVQSIYSKIKHADERLTKLNRYQSKLCDDIFKKENYDTYDIDTKLKLYRLIIESKPRIYNYLLKLKKYSKDTLDSIDMLFDEDGSPGNRRTRKYDMKEYCDRYMRRKMRGGN